MILFTSLNCKLQENSNLIDKFIKSMVSIPRKRKTSATTNKIFVVENLIVD